MVWRASRGYISGRGITSAAQSSLQPSLGVAFFQMTTLKRTIIGILLSGWEFEEGSLAPEDMDHIIKIHNANNESAWQEVTFTIHTFIELHIYRVVL